MSIYSMMARASGSAVCSGSAQGIGAFGFTSAQLAAAQGCLLSAGSAQAMVLFSGEEPTATFGHPIKANESLVIPGNSNVNALRFISAGAPTVLTNTLEW